MIENLVNLIVSITQSINNKPFEIIGAAFFGGLFAGLFSNYFESKRRISDKRSDMYYEHRNTIVQIEHELIPSRVNLYRNIKSLENVSSSIDNKNIRLILRFYKLKLSTGLSLKLLDLNFINEYAEIYTLFEQINSDINYIEGMIGQIRTSQKDGSLQQSLIDSYVKMLKHLQEICLKVDKKSLKILAMCQIALGQEDKEIKKNYQKNGKLIAYKFSDQSMEAKIKGINSQENRHPDTNEQQPNFFVPYMDLKSY